MSNESHDNVAANASTGMLDLSTETTVRIKNSSALKQELQLHQTKDVGGGAKDADVALINEEQTSQGVKIENIPSGSMQKAVEKQNDEDDVSQSQRITLGICAMDKKARSKPMAEILQRLQGIVKVVFFGDECILQSPIEDWPVVDALVAFFSKGYPLKKAQAYVKLRQPFCLNDLQRQEELLDRRRVYDRLEALGICVPKHVFLSRDDYTSTGQTADGNGKRDDLQEFDDYITVNGVTIHKPFVEKPVDAEGRGSDLTALDLLT